MKLKDGSKRIISKNIHFVELLEDGTAVNAGPAPYLDYRAATAEENNDIRHFLNPPLWVILPHFSYLIFYLHNEKKCAIIKVPFSVLFFVLKRLGK